MLGRDSPDFSRTLHFDRARVRDDFAAVLAERTNVPLQKRMRVEPYAIAVDQRGDRPALACSNDRSELVDVSLVNTLHPRERRDRGVQLIEGGELILAGVDQHRHAMSQRDVGEVRRRCFEKPAAR